ncbi:lactoylglutathione lyase-like protein, partial [Trifolium pratense]
VAIGTDDVYKSAEVVDIVTQELGGKITRQPGPIPGLNTKITSFLDPDGWKTYLSSKTYLRRPVATTVMALWLGIGAKLHIEPLFIIMVLVDNHDFLKELE